MGRETGEEGAGGGRRGAGRERGGEMGGRGKEEKYARAKQARAAPRRETRGPEGGEAYPPPCPPPPPHNRAQQLN